MGFDPETCDIENPDYWSEDWEAFEVFNDTDFRRNELDEEGTGTVEDWFGLLDCGYRFSAVGNSDSHDSVFSPKGYPRNCLKLGFDDPAEFDGEDLTGAVLGLKVLVSGGLFIDVDIGGAGMGEIADAPDGKADVNIMVQASEWITADRLRIFMSGEETDTITLDESTRDPDNPVIRFNDAVPVDTGGGDGWVIVVAEGDETMEPVAHGRRPFAATNPIFLDADGDGVFTP